MRNRVRQSARVTATLPVLAALWLGAGAAGRAEAQERSGIPRYRVVEPPKERPPTKTERMDSLVFNVGCIVVGVAVFVMWRRSQGD